jgi:hypothetical protein
MDFIYIDTQAGSRSKRHIFYNSDKCLYAAYSYGETVTYLKCTGLSCPQRAKIQNGIFVQTSGAHNHIDDHAAQAEAEISYEKLKTEVVSNSHATVKYLHTEATKNVIFKQILKLYVYKI